MRQLQHINRAGFSFIEVLIASTLFVGLSAVTYSFLNTQQNKQTNAIKYQAQNRASTTAIERFRADVMLLDPNWINAQVPAVFPHQGYGLGSNYYMDTIMQSEAYLPDGVTFLRRDIAADQLFTLAAGSSPYCVGNAPQNSSDLSLYGSSIQYAAIGFTMAVGDWVLAFENGRSALGVVSQVDASNDKFTLRAPNAQEVQVAQMAGGNVTGLITQPGVLSTTTDVQSLYTPGDTDDDYECFTVDGMKLQKIGNPVSYYMSYATNDGQEKSASNLYVLDGYGQKRKMLVRAELTGTTVQREYLTEVSNLEITYDHYANNESGSEVELGRGAYKGFLLDTNNNFVDLSEYDDDDDPFYYTASIFSMNMNIQNENVDHKNPTQRLVKNHHIKASFDGGSGQSQVVVSVHFESYVSESLSFSPTPSNAYDERVGRPYFFSTGVDQEVVVPVWRHMTNGAIFGAAGSTTVDDDGRITIFDQAGCAANGTGTNGCNPSEQSSIVFYPIDNQTGLSGSGNSSGDMTKFFPTTVNTLDIGGNRVVLVGGIALKGIPDPVTGDISVERSPGFATVVLGQNETLESVVSGHQFQEGEVSEGCSISGCKWFDIANEQLSLSAPDLTDLNDTANLAVTRSGSVLIVPMTKSDNDAKTGIYEAVMQLTNSGLGEQIAEPVINHYTDIDATQNNQIVTAIAERTVIINKEEYLPICTSAPLEECEGGTCTAPTANVGEVRLIKVSDASGSILTTPDTVGVQVSSHNYACNSMTVTDNNDLLISGRLTVAALTHNELKDIVYSGGIPPTLFLDDIAYYDDTNTPATAVYADGFRVDPATYDDASPQNIGWRGGMSSVGMGGMLNLVASNTVRLKDDNNDIYERIDVGVHLLDLPQSGERVLVSIQTDPVNINNTIVTSTFFEGKQADGTTPPSFIPGNYVVNTLSQRTHPTPLPSVGSAMSEEAWYELFEQLQKPKGDQGLNHTMPALEMGATVVKCNESYIQTCADL